MYRQQEERGSNTAKIITVCPPDFAMEWAKFVMAHSGISSDLVRKALREYMERHNGRG